MMLKGLTSWYLLASQLPRGGRRLDPAVCGRRRRGLDSGAVGAASGRPRDWRCRLRRQSASLPWRTAASMCCSLTTTSSRACGSSRAAQASRSFTIPSGATRFLQSLDCLRPHGTLVSFGNSSGKVEPFALQELTKRGSLYVTRPTLVRFHSCTRRTSTPARRRCSTSCCGRHRDRDWPALFARRTRRAPTPISRPGARLGLRS